MTTFRWLWGCFVSLGLILLSSQLIAGDYKPLVKYQIIKHDGVGLIEKWDWASGDKSVTGTVDLSDTEYFRGLDSELYDPINKRIFFIAMYRHSPITIHYYDFASRQILDLPFENYGEPEYILSPDSKYFICTYGHIPYTKTYSANNRKTVVIEAKSLSVVGERIGMGIWSTNSHVRQRTFVSSDNRYLFNFEYLLTPDGEKTNNFVTYSLPELTPLDTTFTYNLFWEGRKGLMDAVDRTLLFSAVKDDDSNDIPSGNYAFLINGVTGELESELIDLTIYSPYGSLLTPDTKEIISIDAENGILTRHSTITGNIIGQIAADIKPFRPAFRKDGYLYINSKSINYHVIDYKNNNVIKTINIER